MRKSTQKCEAMSMMTHKSARTGVDFRIGASNAYCKAIEAVYKGYRTFAWDVRGAEVQNSIVF